MPLWIQMWFYGFMYMDANVDAMQSFWVFIYFDEMLCRMEVLHGVIATTQKNLPKVVKVV